MQLVKVCSVIQMIPPEALKRIPVQTQEQKTFLNQILITFTLTLTEMVQKSLFGCVVLPFDEK